MNWSPDPSVVPWVDQSAGLPLSPQTVVFTVPPPTDPSGKSSIVSVGYDISSSDVSKEDLNKLLKVSSSGGSSSCSITVESNKDPKGKLYDFNSLYSLDIVYQISKIDYTVKSFDDVPENYEEVVSYTAPILGLRTVNLNISVTYEIEDATSKTTQTDTASYVLQIHYEWDDGKEKLRRLVDARRV